MKLRICFSIHKNPVERFVKGPAEPLNLFNNSAAKGKIGSSSKKPKKKQGWVEIKVSTMSQGFRMLSSFIDLSCRSGFLLKFLNEKRQKVSRLTISAIRSWCLFWSCCRKSLVTSAAVFAVAMFQNTMFDLPTHLMSWDCYCTWSLQFLTLEKAPKQPFAFINMSADNIALHLQHLQTCALLQKKPKKHFQIHNDHLTSCLFSVSEHRDERRTHSFV